MMATKAYLDLLVVQLQLGEHLPPLESLPQHALIVVIFACPHG